MHHSLPGEQSAQHAEGSISELHSSHRFQRWSGCQACYPLTRLGVRCSKGKSAGLASHSMSEEEWHGQALGQELYPAVRAFSHVPPLAVRPSAAVDTELAAFWKPCCRAHGPALPTPRGAASVHRNQPASQ